MGNPKVYIDACCFIEMAAHKVGTHKQEPEDDIAFLQQIMTGSFSGEIEVLTSVLSIAECQCAYTQNRDGRILTDQIKQLFRDILTSGQFVTLVQDSILVAERARNLYWVHQLTFSGADAIHIASALEMSCDEYLTFDGKAHDRAKELESLGITVLLPRNTKSLTKEAIEHAERANVAKDQRTLLDDLDTETQDDAKTENETAANEPTDESPVAAPAAIPDPTAQNVSENEQNNTDKLPISTSSNEAAENLMEPSTQTNKSLEQVNPAPEESNHGRPESSSYQVKESGK